MSELHTRPMVEADLEQVLALELKAHSHPWTQGIFKDSLAAGYNCWVLCEGERILGYGVVQIVVGEAELMNITVDPKLQGRGLGKHLLLHLIAVAKTGADTLFLEVRPSNAAAIGLYNALGFNEVGLRRNYYPAKGGGREDALMMALVL